MPKLPYVVFGNTTPALSNYPITIFNITKNSKLNATTTNAGQYLLDLANMDKNYSTGDSMRVYIQYNSYFGNTDWTLSGAGGVQEDITIYGGIDISTLRTDMWNVVNRTLKDGIYEIDTNNIHSAMNDVLISSEGYPQVVVYSPAIETSTKNFKKEMQEKKINIMIEIYHSSAESLKVLTDQIEDKFWLAEKDNYWTNFKLYNLDMPDNDYDFWTDNKKTIHKATLNANFTYLGRR